MERLPNASHPCFYTGTHHVVNLTMYDLYGDRDHTSQIHIVKFTGLSLHEQMLPLRYASTFYEYAIDQIRNA